MKSKKHRQRCNNPYCVTTKKLRRKFKTKKPVRVFFRRFKAHERRNAMGFVDYKANTYEIHVDSSRSLDTQWLVLLHEWAHAMSGPLIGHQKQWGINHSKVIRALERKWK